ncbi:MAG: hypothetical protein ACRDGG_01525, partial [Anaerolineae bacterium]
MDAEQKLALLSDNAALEPSEEKTLSLPSCHTSNPHPTAPTLKGVPVVFGDPRNVEFKGRADAAARPHSQPTGHNPKDLSNSIHMAVMPGGQRTPLLKTMLTSA